MPAWGRRLALEPVLRRIVIALVVVLVLVAAVVVAAKFWLASDDPRLRLQQALGEVLQREVTIAGLDVEGEHVVLTEVSIGNPEGFAGAPLFSAERIELEVALDDLMDGRIAGVVAVQGVELRIAKQNGTTNLLGPLGRGTGEGALDLHIDLAMTSSRLVLEDLDRGQSLALEGVGMRVLVSNREGARRGQAHVTIAEVGLHGLPLREVELFATANDDAVEIERLVGTLGTAGRVRGNGRLWLGGDKGWSFTIAAEGVDIDGDVRPLVVGLFPPLATTVAATAASGKVAADTELSGTGLHWERIRPTLVGKGTATLSDLRLPEGSLVPEIATLVGHEGAWTLALATVEFTLADEWVQLARVTADRERVPVPVEGGVSLGGVLELRVDVLPLVRIFGRGAQAAVGQYASSLPVRIRGTVQKPEIALPTASDVGRSLLGGAMRRALTTDAQE